MIRKGGEHARTRAGCGVRMVKIRSLPVPPCLYSRCQDPLDSLCSVGLSRLILPLPRVIVESVAESSVYSLIDSASVCTVVSRTILDTFNHSIHSVDLIQSTSSPKVMAIAPLVQIIKHLCRVAMAMI